MKEIAYFLSICALTANAYNGRVYNDANANGLFDKGDTPLANIAVSDGLNVVTTDKLGKFNLPGHSREKFIFITTPSGYTANDAYYIAISDSVDSYDFPLVKYNAGIGKDGSHKFIHITDTEIFNTHNHEDWVNNIKDYADNENVAFIIHTGDICYEKGLKNHRLLMNSKNIHHPMFYTIGNHDLVSGEHGEDLFESLYGPVYYSFDVAGTHYIVTPMADGDHTPGYTTEDVVKWAKNDLACVAPGTPVILFNHNLPMYDPDFTYGNDENSIKFADHNIKAWVYGHWHINHVKNQGNALTVCTSTPDKGGIDHSQAAFRVINVAKNGNLKMELRYPYLDRHIAIAAPQGLTATPSIVVNAYDTSSPVVNMQYTLLHKGSIVSKARNLSQATDWCWTATIPDAAKYADKEMQIRVTATLKDGRTIHTDSKYTYAPGSVSIMPVDNWTNLRGNASHSVANKTANISNEPTLVWTANVGSNIYMSSPVIYNGIVYVASIDENAEGKSSITAFDIVSGQQKWKYPLPTSIKNSIAVDQGILFAQDADGTLYAIDGLTGKLCWHHKLSVANLPNLIDGLIAENGIVYAGSGHGLSAYEATTGKQLWENTEWSQGEGTTSTLTLADNVLIGNAQWSALHSNDAKTGKKLWSISDYGIRHRAASAAIYNGLIYLISYKSFFIIEPESGNIICQKELPYNLDVTSSPLLTENSILFGSADKGVVAIDNKTFEPLWNFSTDDALIYTAPYTRSKSSTVETSPVQVGNIICVAASDGTLYGIDAATGSRVWKYATGAPIFGTPATTGNTVIFTDYGGNIYAIVWNK